MVYRSWTINKIIDLRRKVNGFLTFLVKNLHLKVF